MDYRQCTMKKKDSFQVAWIPERFAVMGKYLRIGEDDGWKVESVSNVVQTSEENNERSQDYKRTRKASDI